MPENSKILVRNARDQDIPAVAEIDAEAFAPYGTVETPETFQRRLAAFPNGFIVLIADNEIAAYGCSEKWLTEREPGLDENPQQTHQLDGKIFYITAMAVKMQHREKGYSLLILDKLIEIAHLEGCKKVMIETSHAQNLYTQRGFKLIKNRSERGLSLDVLALDLEPISGKL